MNLDIEHGSNNSDLGTGRKDSELIGDDDGLGDGVELQIYNSCKYYSKITFDNLAGGKKFENNFGVLHLNADSLRNKEEALGLFLQIC